MPKEERQRKREHGGKFKKKIRKQTDEWEVKPVRALAPGRKTYRRGSLRRALRRIVVALTVIVGSLPWRTLTP